MSGSKSNLAGWIGVILYALAVINFYGARLWLRLDHKDLFWGGTGLLLIAIWQSVSSHHKQNQ